MTDRPHTTRLIVRAPIASLHGEPRISSPQISQRLAGHAVDLLETQGDWLRVRGDDGYEGWVHRGFLAVDSSGAPTEAEGARKVLSLGCRVRGGDGRTRSFPLGALLDPADRVLDGETIIADQRAKRFAADGEAIARTAQDRYAGTSYQWGGSTPWGADCSGMVQTVFWLHGVPLPRDAWMQAQVGLELPRDLAALVPGDLLFFSDRPDDRITHAAVALGSYRIVHCALGRGGWAVDDLADQGDPYVASLRASFRSARRVTPAA